MWPPARTASSYGVSAEQLPGSGVASGLAVFESRCGLGEIGAAGVADLQSGRKHALADRQGGVGQAGKHGLECDERDLPARLLDGGEGRRDESGEFRIVKTQHPQRPCDGGEVGREMPKRLSNWASLGMRPSLP